MAQLEQIFVHFCYFLLKNGKNGGKSVKKRRESGYQVIWMWLSGTQVIREWGSGNQENRALKIDD